MKKITAILLLAFLLAFTCAFDVIYDPVDFEDQEQIVTTDPVQNIPENVETIDDPAQPGPAIDGPAVEGPAPQPPAEGPVPQPPAGEPAPQPPAGGPAPLPPAEEPAVDGPEMPVWQDIDEDQISLLSAIFEAMTDTGKVYSGWFRDGDHAPCGWQGIACEAGRVTKLEFKNAGFFTEFPEAILDLHDLKELHMVDTMMRGPLPEDLFDDLQKLEVLELKGNYLTGEIPELPGAFAVYPMLRSITISDNLDDLRKTQLLSRPEYADVVNYQVDPYQYPDLDLTPGLDGNLQGDWDRLPQLNEIDLSGNQLKGEIPESYAQILLTKLDLSNNAEQLLASENLYDSWASLSNPQIKLEGIRKPEPAAVPTEEPVAELPTEEPIVEWPTEEPVAEWPTAEPAVEWPTAEPVVEWPTEEPVVEWPTVEPVVEWPTVEPVVEWPTPEPVIEIPTEPAVVPTAAPTQAPVFDPPKQPTPVPPTQVPPTPVPTEKKPDKKKPQPTPIIIVVTATPVPKWYTATPETYYYPPQPPAPQGYPNYPQQYYPPQPNNPQGYPNYQQQNYYPTATPNTYYNPMWVYPTATSSYSYTYPQYGQNQQSPTAVPTQDPASLLGFTYTMTEMTENNIPMTWRFTGMRDYSITYLNADGELYPYYAMPWTNASELCNASVCNASVQNIPDELLQGGTFSLQLRARDAAGRTYLSDPVVMQVAVPEPTPVSEPEPQRSFLGGFFHWLFGPIIRLFGGK